MPLNTRTKNQFTLISDVVTGILTLKLVKSHQAIFCQIFDIDRYSCMKKNGTENALPRKYLRMRTKILVIQTLLMLSVHIF